jgi:selenocysteine lyase/cysteine desulfurase
MNSETVEFIMDDYVRKAFPVLSKVNYLNVGTYGLMPLPAIEKLLDIQSEFEQTGQASIGDCYRMTEQARRSIATMLNVKPEEIAFTRNATDGINIVLSGMQWKPGDEVITTDQEHEAMIHPLMFLQKRRGIKIKFISVTPDPNEFLEKLDHEVNNKTRLVAMSLVTCETGTRLPAAEISDWAKQHDLLTLFDGAQVSGAFPIDIRRIGCDFYTSNGHKWLSGPKGTGFFYIKNEQIDRLIPAYIGAGSLEKVDVQSNTADLFPTALRFEFGTRSWTMTAGLNASLEWFEKIGWDRVYQHISALNDYLKKSIMANPSLKLITPESFHQSSGLTSFTVTGFSANEIATKLREQFATYVRVIPHYNAIRIATAHFNVPEDINRLMNSIETIING